MLPQKFLYLQQKKSKKGSPAGLSMLFLSPEDETGSPEVTRGCETTALNRHGIILERSYLNIFNIPPNTYQL